MVNLESEIPYFYWTFDRLDDLNQDQRGCGFEGSVWKADMIPSYDIGEAQLTLESPVEWGDFSPPVSFHRTPEGRYEHHSGRVIYDAVRADTQTHVILTGRWTETDFGKGVFIAVLPVKQSAEVLLEMTTTVPVGVQMPELVSRP
jgi:hypothetical protein